MTTFNLPSFPRRRESKFSSVTTEDDAWISACAGMTECVGGFQNVKVIDGRYFSGKKAPKRAPAFTLVEILVVIVIIGIGLAIAVANLFVSDEEKVRHEALRLMALIEKTRDHAAFSGYAIAMRLGENGIEFLERDPNSIEPKWQDATRDSLKPRLWRDGVTASMALSSAASPSTQPQLVTFFPAGVGTPFTVRVASASHQRIIVGDALGNVAFAATK